MNCLQHFVYSPVAHQRRTPGGLCVAVMQTDNRSDSGPHQLRRRLDHQVRQVDGLHVAVRAKKVLRHRGGGVSSG